jgi:hypothetical protein
MAPRPAVIRTVVEQDAHGLRAVALARHVERRPALRAIVRLMIGFGRIVVSETTVVGCKLMSLLNFFAGGMWPATHLLRVPSMGSPGSARGTRGSVRLWP